MNIPIFLQSSPVWGGKEIAPGVTMGRFGCLITCLSMALQNSALDLDPGRLCDALKAANAFSATGDMTLSALEKVTNRVTFHSRKATTNCKDLKYGERMDPQSAFDRIRGLVMLGMPTPVNVDLVGKDGVSDHWVLSVDVEGSDLIINDPAYGDSLRFTKRYGDPLTGIYGYAAYVIQPVEVPMGGHLKFGQSMAKVAEAWRQLPYGPAKVMLREALDSFI